MEDFSKASCLAKHIILLTTSAHLRMKIKTMATAKEMWEEVNKDTAPKSTLLLVDAEHQLKSIQLAKTADPKTHLTELKTHFKLMMLWFKNLMEMGSTFSEYKLITLSSLLTLYWPMFLTLSTAEKAAKVKTSFTTSSLQPAPMTLTSMTPYELVNYFIEEAEHQMIEECTKLGESALSVQAKDKKRRKGKGKGKSDKQCENCRQIGHVKEDCYDPGGAKRADGQTRVRKSNLGAKANRRQRNQQWQQKLERISHSLVPWPSLE